MAELRRELREANQEAELNRGQLRALAIEAERLDLNGQAVEGELEEMRLSGAFP